MSKYNLSDILNEYIGGGRIGTLRTTAKHIIDKMDELEEDGEVVVRELQGPSGDGKVNMEFEVVDREFAVPGGNKQERGFTVYDYKFGFDPRDPDHVDVEYDYSIGGNDIRLAMDLFRGDTRFEIVKGMFKEDLFSKDGGSEDNVDNIDQVASPSAKGKGYSSAVDAERSESGKEQSNVTQTTKPMYEENEEKDMPMDEEKGIGQLYVQPAVQKEIRFHLDAFEKGDIDVDDMIQAIEDIIFGRVPAPGMRENGHVDDYADEIAEDKDDYNFEKKVINLVMKEKSVPVSVAQEFFKTHKDDIVDMSDDEILDEYEEFRSVNYDYIDEDLKAHFKRFK